MKRIRKQYLSNTVRSIELEYINSVARFIYVSSVCVKYFSFIRTFKCRNVLVPYNNYPNVLLIFCSHGPSVQWLHKRWPTASVYVGVVGVVRVVVCPALFRIPS